MLPSASEPDPKTSVRDADHEIPLRSLARPAGIAAQLTQLEHVLKRPDTYIGSVEPVTQPMWVYDQELEKMVYRCVFPFSVLAGRLPRACSLLHPACQ